MISGRRKSAQFVQTLLALVVLAVSAVARSDEPAGPADGVTEDTSGVRRSAARRVYAISRAASVAGWSGQRRRADARRAHQSAIRIRTRADRDLVGSGGRNRIGQGSGPRPPASNPGQHRARVSPAGAGGRPGRSGVHPALRPRQPAARSRAAGRRRRIGRDLPAQRPGRLGSRRPDRAQRNRRR